MTFTEDAWSCASTDFTYSLSSVTSDNGADTSFISIDTATGVVSWHKASVSGVTASTFTIEVTATLGSPGSPS